MPSGLIDLHHHALLPDYVAALARLGITGEGGLGEFPHWNADSDLKLMDRRGISIAVLSVSSPGVYFDDISLARRLAGLCNEQLARVVQQHPTRFGALATLPLPDLDAALAELAYALDELKVDGVVLLTNVGGRYLGDPYFDPLMEELDRRRVTVFIHPCGPRGADADQLSVPTTTVDFVFDPTRAAANLLFTGRLEKFSNISYILSHAGGAVPFVAWRLAIGYESKHMPLRDFAVHAVEKVTGHFERDVIEEGSRGLELLRTRFYYDTALSATPYALASLQALVGPDRIVFGSDIPFAPEFIVAESVTGLANHAKFDPEGRAFFERGNALRLFPRLANVG